MSPDERLEKYVTKNDIVDIEFDKNVLAAAFDEDDEGEEEYDWMHPPVELDNATFPDITVSFDSDEDNDDTVGYAHGAGEAKAQEDNVVLVGGTTASKDVTATQVNILPQTFQGEVSNSVSLAAPKAAPPGPDRTMTSSLWSETTGRAVANKHPETFRVSEYLTFTLQEAWDNGNIAQNHSILSGRHRVEYKFLFPTLTCGECCFLHSKTLISVVDIDYYNSNRSTNRWYDGVFISSFAQLAAHYTHLTVSEQSSDLGDSYKQPLLLHVTYPNQILQEGKYKALPDHVTKVVAVMHDRDHCAMMEIDIPVKKVVIFDGLYKDLKKWMDHVVSGMKQCMLLGLIDAIHHRADEPSISNVGGSRHPQKAIHACSLFLGLEERRLERGDFIKQVDTFNCGPIACMKILDIYNLTTLYKVNLAYNTNSIRSFVISEWTRLVAHCNNDLILGVSEHIPLLEPQPEDGENTTAPHRSYPTIDAAVAAAAAASADAPEADMDICFCCCDSLAMELVCLTYCKKTIHWQCPTVNVVTVIVLWIWQR